MWTLGLLSLLIHGLMVLRSLWPIFIRRLLKPSTPTTCGQEQIVSVFGNIQMKWHEGLTTFRGFGGTKWTDDKWKPDVGRYRGRCQWNWWVAKDSSRFKLRIYSVFEVKYDLVNTYAVGNKAETSTIIIDTPYRECIKYIKEIFSSKNERGC